MTPSTICPAAASLSMEELPATAFDTVASVWKDLYHSAAQRSFFLSAPWTKTWIDVFADALDVSIAIFRAGEPVGACLLVKKSRRRLLLPIRRLSLNASGESTDETTYIEYNGLLCESGWEPAIAACLAEYAGATHADEVAVDGIEPGPAYDALRRALADFELDAWERPSYHVDLDALRRSAGGYEMSLGRATRKHLRQDIRQLSELGPVCVRAAADSGEALRMFEEMAELNRVRWQLRGRNSPFSSPRFLAFHRSLITLCVDTGNIELLRVSAGHQTVGIVYTFLDRRKVYLYQTGLNYELSSLLSPGTVAQFYVIQRSLETGASDFDFLAGSEPYKQRLSTGSRTLVWAVFRKSGVKMRLVDSARAAGYLLGRPNYAHESR
jgi:CelD/BcsL family acetyltransferase involved in cellulose biosynthesis